MSLADWQRNGWLTPRNPSRREIAELLRAADQYLADCEVTGLSSDSRLAIAYSAGLAVAGAVLAACGYRVEHEAHHYRLIQSLDMTIGATGDEIARFEAFRTKRNTATYRRVGQVSPGEADEMAALVRELRTRTQHWLERHHPDLVP